MDTTNIFIARKIAALTIPLQEESIKRLASILIRRDLDKGAQFVAKGEICTQIGYVHKGLVRQFYHKHKRDLTEHFSCEQELFMCIESFLHQVPSDLAVEALEDTVIYGIPHDPLIALCAEDYDIELLYRRLLEDALILSQHKADFRRFETASRRYGRLLRERPQIVRRAPLSDIASYLLMSRETLSRVRANLDKDDQ